MRGGAAGADGRLHAKAYTLAHHLQNRGLGRYSPSGVRGSAPRSEIWRFEAQKRDFLAVSEILTRSETHTVV